MGFVYSTPVASGDPLDQKKEYFKCPLILVYTPAAKFFLLERPRQEEPERIGYIDDKNSPNLYTVGMVGDVCSRNRRTFVLVY